MWRWTIALLACCPLVAAAQAQSPTTRDDLTDQRYVFHEVDDGILRLDTRLGEISLCTSRPNIGWTCRSLPDERNAIDAELARLQQENAELKNALAAQAKSDAAKPELPAVQSAPQPEASEKSSEQKAVTPEAGKPTEQKPAEQATRPHDGDLARVREVIGIIWNRLVEMMANLRADLSKDS